MTAAPSDPAPHIENRWPVVLAIIAVVGMLTLMPGRIKVLPTWSAVVIAAITVAPIVAVALTRGQTRWLRIERWVIAAFVVIVIAGNLINLARLMEKMIRGPSDVSGLQLFASSIAVWMTNVLAFALIYWQLDRGGPERRVNGAGVRPDWIFPHEGAPEELIAPGWQPDFIDYMFLGYSTATAFSATDALPLTHRAKLLMMVESTISLLTIVVIAARAISLIG